VSGGLKQGGVACRALLLSIHGISEIRPNEEKGFAGLSEEEKDRLISETLRYVLLKGRSCHTITNFDHKQ